MPGPPLILDELRISFAHLPGGNSGLAGVLPIPT